MKIVKYLYLKLIFISLLSQIGSTENSYKSSNIVVIPFKIYYPNEQKIPSEFSSLDYYNLYHLSKIYLELEVDNNKNDNKIQILSLFIGLDDYLFIVDDNYFKYNNSKLCRYSTSLSPSYKVIDSANVIMGKTSFYASDIFKIYTDSSMIKYQQSKMEFLYYKDTTKNISFACGKIGFLFPSEKKGDLWQRNFLNQITSHITNIDYSFSFNYNYNEDKEKMNDGFLIVGVESYEKKFEKNKNLISIYNKIDEYGNKQKWKFDMDQIFINNKYYQFDEGEFIISTDIEGFEFPYAFYIKLNEIFFYKYFENNICKSEYIIKALKLVVISCDGNSFNKKDIESFPDIQFLKYKLGFNFTFIGEELFYKKNNTYFFKIVFNSLYLKKEFKLGRLFLKKYQVIFNPDSNCINFYKNINNNIQSNSSNDKKSYYQILIRYAIISILFLIIGVYLGRKFCLLRRKKYAKELEDDDFILNNEIKKREKENKLIEF